MRFKGPDTPALPRLERVIAAISPRIAFQRQKYRAAMTAARSYDGAGLGPRLEGLRPPSSDANVTNRDAQVLRDRCRDKMRNSPIARSAVRVVTNGIVGDGIVPRIDTGSDATNRRMMDDVLHPHLETTAVDARGRLNLYGLQRQVVKSLCQGGEILWMQRPRRQRDGLRLGFQVEALEPEYLDTKDYGLHGTGGETTFDGIVFDQIGRRRGYKLYRGHPYGDQAFGRETPLESRVVPARRVIHVYDAEERPGQNRGVPWLAPVLTLINDLEEFLDAKLVGQKVGAMFAAFEHDLSGDVQTSGTEDQASYELMPGMVQKLGPGRSITFSQPPIPQGQDDFVAAYMRLIAIGMASTYESVSGDLSDVSFLSGRMGQLQAQAEVSARQWTLMYPALLAPFSEWIFDYLGMVPGAPREMELKWVPPRFPMLDPVKEIKASRDKVRAGFSSRTREVAEMGYDAESLEAEIAAENARADRAQLSFDSDGRRRDSDPTTGIGPLAEADDRPSQPQGDDDADHQD